MQFNPERVESRRPLRHPSGVAQSLSRNFIHIIFSTKNRQPFLQPVMLREELHRYLGGILAGLECQPIIVGGVEDHVHLLCCLSRTSTQARLVQEAKRSSSLWLKTKDPKLAAFAWQNGYGVFSLGFSQIEAARKYIAGQEKHHKKVSFQDEFRGFLRRYEIEFDERWVWD